MGQGTASLSTLLRDVSQRDGETPVASQNDYASLKRRIQDAGLLDKRPGYYALSISTNLILFFGCLVVLFSVGTIWGQALAAVALGIISGQLGFQLHDSGHRQMFASPGKNALVGLFTADVLLGMSYGWWVQKHNRHRRKVGRLVAMYQVYFFFPLTTFLAWSMHLTGATYLVKESSRYRRLEFAMLAAHAIVYLGVMFFFLGPWSALMVVLIHKAVGGAYLASVFAPNHKGMPQTDSSSRLDFVRTQVLTARNIYGHPVTDLWYGSLNYQIEHHLFPNMPRLNMRRAQPIVKQFCAERGIDYYETSFLQSYRELLGFLNEVGAPLREAQIQG